MNYSHSDCIGQSECQYVLGDTLDIHLASVTPSCYNVSEIFIFCVLANMSIVIMWQLMVDTIFLYCVNLNTCRIEYLAITAGCSKLNTVDET